MIALRCSDRATLDLAARIDLRCADLWQQLDDVQEALSVLVEMPSGPVTGPWIDRAEYKRLAERERQLLRELEDWS